MALTQMGRKFFVCATPQDDDLLESEFKALDWVEVKKVVNIGQTGTEENVLTLNTMDTLVADKQKGIANAGDPTLEVAYDAVDPGQVLMRTLALTKLKYAFKSEFDDSVGVGGTPTTKYNRGLVLGPAEPNGGPEDFLIEQYTLALVQKQITVAAVAGT